MTQAIGRAGPGLAAVVFGAACGAAAGPLLHHPHQIAASAVLAGAMAFIAVEDIRRFTVPDHMNLFGALAGFAAIWLGAQAAGQDVAVALGGAAFQMVVCGGSLLLMREAFFRIRGQDGLGLGDVKLAATAGVWLGWEHFALAILLAAAGALLFVGVHSTVHGPWPAERRIPFAFYLAPAIWVIWFLSRL